MSPRAVRPSGHRVIAAIAAIAGSTAIAAIAGCAGGVAPPASGPVPASPRSVAAQVEPGSPELPRYVPPPGAGAAGPVRILGSTSRGTHDEAVAISVIAPDHVGLTTSAQPTLYWHASGAPSRPVELTIQDERGIRPLVETRLAGAAAAGFGRIRMSDLGQSLEPDRDYRWTISLVVDPANRSRDIVASGMIRRIAGPGSQAVPTADAGTLARQGLWYDALQALGDQIAATPDDPLPRRQRDALLRQVGLPIPPTSSGPSP